MRRHTYPDERLPSHFDTDIYMTRARNYVPSTAFEKGLADRAERDKIEGRHRRSKGYFLRHETPQRWREYDEDEAWARGHREAWKNGQPFDPDLVYIVNRLAAYAGTLGWRALPGIRWACDVVRRPELAEDYETVIRDLLRDADAFHRQLAKKPTREFLQDTNENLIRPLLADFRRVTATVVAELRQYPELQDELPEARDLLRFG